MISEICLAAGDPAAALAGIDRAIGAAPSVAIYHHNRGAILAGLGREDEARQALAEARRLDPGLGVDP
jgi:Flp pilus assembly protein TadD